ncbi:MAG: Phosphonate ABC transporter, permease protein PhnE [Anaerolineales bacterium]|nr:Phosphonate ABC transporter, permease protein PhnE [Anaerolineales bacterium]MBM2847382.1 Phosphonate transporter, permease protein PhnE [Anaerolineales bacterium]
MVYALASLLVPGLGQFLGGRRARGLSLFGLMLVTLGLVWWVVTPAYAATDATITFKGEPANWFWLAVPVVVWLWIIWDAAFPERPLWIPILTALVMFYSLGWRASGIDAGALFRNFDRALLVLRPMLRPDFVQPRAERLEAWVELLVPCSPTPLPGTNTLGSTTLTLSAGCAQVGDSLTVTGSGFWVDSEAQLIWQSPIGDFFLLREAGSTQTITTQTDAQGNLTATFVVPNAIPPGIDPTLPQEQRLYIRQARPIGGYELSTNGQFVVLGIYQTVALALMATTLGTLFAVPISFLAARNLMSANPVTLAVYVVVRTLLNIVRSIEALIIAIVFVVFVGLGPFAGMLALSVHTVAALAKLYSEVIEGIDPGPIEAMQATGANWLQVVRYGVVPQIVPPFTAFTIYRWDINVRSSTIVGLVGGGGIGFFLVQWINLSDFRAVSASFIAILVVVMTMDLVSASIRERLI